MVNREEFPRKLIERVIQNWHLIVIAFLLSLGIYIRFFTYGDLRLSIGTDDTASYIKCSKVPLLTWDSLVCRRPITTSIFYRINQPTGDYELKFVNNPAGDKKYPFRGLQYGLDRIVLEQSISSIFCWFALAIILARRLQNQFLKITSTIIILFLAVSPQIADWDSVLSSESLSISLSVLLFGLLIENAFWIAGKNTRHLWLNGIIWGFWLIVFFFFLFVRDSNLYFIPITLGMIIPLFFLKAIRIQRWILLASTIYLLCLLLIGYVSSSSSMRWRNSINDVYVDEIYPYPSRVAYFQKLGMPPPGNPDHMDWFNHRAHTTYIRFLLSHPGYVLIRLVESKDLFFSENIQPYFHEKTSPARKYLHIIGDTLHSKSSAILLADFLLVFGIGAFALKTHHPSSSIWAWLFSWLFLVSSFTLFISFISDTGGVIRHVLGSVVYYRLLFWAIILVFLDILLQPGSPSIRIKD